MRRAFRWRTPIRVLLATVLVAVIVLLGGGWHFSNVLRDGGLLPKYDDPEPDLKVITLGEGRVTLGVTPETKEDGDWMRKGVLGLVGDTSYNRVGAVIALTDQQVTREFIPLSETPNIGEMVRLDSYAFPDDPQIAHGLPFEEVSYSSPLGDFPAWLVDGDSETWAIFVHGHRAQRREALRMLLPVAELGLPSLIITYRNDEGVPANPDGFIRFGQTEWEDLEGAARYALGHGAEDLILIGYSMGGGIVASFLYRSPLAEQVRGVILDAPMLDFGQTVDLRAPRQRIPVVNLPIPGPVFWVLVPVAKSISNFRFSIDWGALDYVKRADELAVPILLFHGDADTEVPLETSDALAKARPDIVEYHRVADTLHVRSWNVDPAAYEATVKAFLRRVTQ